jgi:hypothetical protein
MKDQENVGSEHPATVEGRTDKPAELSQQELKAQGGEELPDREAMSLINANAAVPVNAAVAANVLSDGSTAVAGADQSNDIDQQIKR